MEGINKVEDIMAEVDKLTETKKEEIKQEEIKQERCSECPDEDTNLEIPFCCVTTMPRGFDLEIPEDKFLVYDVSCLHCCLEECDIEVTAHCCGTDVDIEPMPGYSVKVVGCIRYAAAAFPVKKYDESDTNKLCGGRFIEEEGGVSVFDNTGAGYVCCQGCVCVDKVIGCRTTNDSTCVCDCPEFNCETVQVKNFKVEELDVCEECGNGGTLPDQRPVKFSGCFVIPGCVRQ